MTDDVHVRTATPDDLPAVLGVLDAAALETGGERVRARVERGDALVAVAEPADSEREDGTVVGALVLDGAEVDAVAVRRRRRDQGIGRALVEAAAERVARAGTEGPDTEERSDHLVAAFDAGVAPFYESLGFTVEPADERGRYRGRLELGE